MHGPGPRDDSHPAGDFSAPADEVTCEQFVELVTKYFEGALTPRVLSQVEEHLVICDWCLTYAEQMQATIDSLRSLKEESPREPPGPVLLALRRKAAGQ